MRNKNSSFKCYTIHENNDTWEHTVHVLKQTRYAVQSLFKTANIVKVCGFYSCDSENRPVIQIRPKNDVSAHGTCEEKHRRPSDSRNHVSSFTRYRNQMMDMTSGLNRKQPIRRSDFTSCGDVRESPKIWFSSAFSVKWSNKESYLANSFMLKYKCLNQTDVIKVYLDYQWFCCVC